jgi:hypothetical protein
LIGKTHPDSPPPPPKWEIARDGLFYFDEDDAAPFCDLLNSYSNTLTALDVALSAARAAHPYLQPHASGHSRARVRWSALLINKGSFFRGEVVGSMVFRAASTGDCIGLVCTQ